MPDGLMPIPLSFNGCVPGWRRGFEPPIVVISGLSADEALEAETTFIAGRRSNATGPLYALAKA
jgi:hypothetical protein